MTMNPSYVESTKYTKRGVWCPAPTVNRGQHILENDERKKNREPEAVVVEFHAVTDTLFSQDSTVGSVLACESRS